MKLSYAITTLILIIATGSGTYLLTNYYYQYPITETMTTYVVSSTTESLTTPSTALVFGLTSATGLGTNVTIVVFTNVESGEVSTIPVVNAHHFSVRLPNMNTYNATVHWIGPYYWQTGSIYQGTVTLNWGPGTTDAQSFNIVIDTPNSLINLSGTAQASTVRFTTANGLAFETPVINGSYIAELPNMMNYSALLKTQYGNGTTTDCIAGSMSLFEPAGVSNSTWNLAC